MKKQAAIADATRIEPPTNRVRLVWQPKIREAVLKSGIEKERPSVAVNRPRESRNGYYGEQNTDSDTEHDRGLAVHQRPTPLRLNPLSFADRQDER